MKPVVVAQENCGRLLFDLFVRYKIKIYKLKHLIYETKC